MGSISHYDPLKSQFITQKRRHQCFVQCRRHPHFLFRQFRGKFAYIFGKHDMAAHNPFDPIFDQFFVNHTIRLIPVFWREIIDMIGQMGIAVIHTISRKMFRHTGKIRILVRTPHIFDTAFFYHFRIIGKGSCRNFGIHRIVIDIADRRKCHIAPDCRRFCISHAPHVFRVIMVSCRSNLHAIADICAIRACTIAAGFRIAGDKQRNLAVFLQNAVLLPYLPRRCRIVATASEMIRLYQFDQILFFL